MVTTIVGKVLITPLVISAQLSGSRLFDGISWLLRSQVDLSRLCSGIM